jgi:MFS family permease
MPQPPSPLGTRALLGLAITSALVPLNSTMIAVALPDVADDFGIGSGSAGVLVTIYLVVMFIGQPTLGRLIDIVGARRALHWGLIGFIGVSVATSFAASFPLLVLGRAAQAIFGAALMPSAQALLRSLSEPAERGRSFGMLGSFIGAGAASGPVVGGLVVALGGWRGIFLINVPIAAAALWSVANMPSPSINRGRDPGTPGLSHVLTRRPFGAAFLTQATTTLSQYSLLLVVPIVLDGRDWNSAQVGAALTALTAGMVLMGPVGGRFGDRRGRRFPVIIGVGAAGFATVLAALMVEGSSAGVVAAITIFGFGLGFAIPSVQTAALESVPEEFAGSAAGILSMSRYSGSIPASILFALLVSEGGGGSQSLLAIASLAMVAAVLAATMLPSGVQDVRSEGSE